MHNIKTGFNKLDKILNDLNRKEVITIAGRPSLFKTTLCINIINNVLKQTNSKKVLFFTLESSKEILCKSFTSNKVEIIDDVYFIEDIKSKCKKIIKQDTSLVVIDYLQIIF